MHLPMGTKKQTYHHNARAINNYTQSSIGLQNPKINRYICTHMHRPPYTYLKTYRQRIDRHGKIHTHKPTYTYTNVLI